MSHRASLVSTGLVLFAWGGFASAGEKYLEMGAKQWRYLETAKAPAKDWFGVKFDDSKWKTGQAPLGYGDDDIQQEISFGDDEDNKRTCAFFRRAVEIKDPKAFKMMLGKLICDDGCVVYVNGKEVYRLNLPQG